MDKHNKVLDIIINLLDGLRSGGDLRDDFGGEDLVLNDCSYLLNQSIRQYKIPQCHYFVSKKAFELWSKIRSDSIFNYWYRKKVVKNVEGEVFINKYRGGEKEPYSKNYKLKYGETFTFNDVFTDEHIVPVNNIIKELINLPVINYESVKNVLDKIYICKVLKEEDRKIANKKSRSLDYREVLAFDYFDVGIEIKDFDLKTELLTLIDEIKRKIDKLKDED